jgi:hypothetical protein
MSLAIAALGAKGPTTLHRAEAAAVSYPHILGQPHSPVPSPPKSAPTHLWCTSRVLKGCDGPSFPGMIHTRYPKMMRFSYQTGSQHGYELAGDYSIRVLTRISWAASPTQPLNAPIF